MSSCLFAILAVGFWPLLFFYLFYFIFIFLCHVCLFTCLYPCSILGLRPISYSIWALGLSLLLSSLRPILILSWVLDPSCLTFCVFSCFVMFVCLPRYLLWSYVCLIFYVSLVCLFFLFLCESRVFLFCILACLHESCVCVFFLLIFCVIMFVWAMYDYLCLLVFRPLKTQLD